jgi:predicted Rossmann fold flavoprotein
MAVPDKVIVVGGGAAGLMASYAAASEGADVLLLEAMSAVGRKLLITGKGRCNFTNRADFAEFIANFPGNAAFLHSSLRAFSNQDVIDFFAAHGVPSKVERGGRLFPVSDQARDIVTALFDAARGAGVKILTGRRVRSLMIEEGQMVGVQTAEHGEFRSGAVIVATGGLSYPTTGSTGDGYEMARFAGHSVTPLRPALVPLESPEEWVKSLQGLSLRNVSAVVKADGKKLAEDFGEMLFTHFGVSGPIVLSLSSAAQIALSDRKVKTVQLEINLKPALTPETLDQRLQRDFTQFSRKQFKNSLFELLPIRLVPVMIELSGISPEKPTHQVTRAERIRFAELLQCLPLRVTKTRPVSEAVVTAGGVSVKEINPRTMGSKHVEGLYFAGEVIDVDGYTGGFNLQAAFSTGFAAGRAAARQAMKA